jgi:HAD superfamily hydrolase (TIGR01549 family)
MIIFTTKNVEAVIFDLDDTLVKTNLDFAGIKAELGCDSSEDILSFVESISCSEQRNRAHHIILQHELEDARTSTWIDGAREFVSDIAAEGLPMAIVTRNCKAATDLKLLKNSIEIDRVITREDAPPKPNPEALLRIASEWGLPPEKIAYIGDYKYDIFAAHNADMQAWLYTNCADASSYLECLKQIYKNNPLFQQ